jgi:formylglycine-generating enzyme
MRLSLKGKNRTLSALLVIGVALSLQLFSRPPAEAAPARASSPCPPEMVPIANYCIDRYEIHTVDDKTGQRLSPFYPPEPKLLRVAYSYWAFGAGRESNDRASLVDLPVLPLVERGDFAARAVSAPGVLPQGYLTYFSATAACARAGKRLCTEPEWTRACRSDRGTKHPYGDTFEAGRCNVFRAMHPAFELHGNSSVGHLDPRLHLVLEEGKTPMLFPTMAKTACASKHRDDALYDMVGNLDEWILDPNGTFVGGFYARSTREGCEAKIENHGPAYTDYSLGTRCCKDP